MGLRPGSDGVLAAIGIAASLLLLFVWIPLDTETGLIERVRGRSNVGDALAPTVAAALLLAASVALFARSCFVRQNASGLNLGHASFLVRLLLLFLLAFTLMRWFGPLLVWIADAGPYRELRATFPLHISGFIVGGTLLVAGLVGLIDGRSRPSHWLVAAVITIAMALFYDRPFEDLLLPPNGDV